MFNSKKSPSVSHPVPSIRRYRVSVASGDSVVPVQEFSGPDLSPDEPIKFALSLFASSSCSVSVLAAESNGTWSPVVSLFRHDC